VLLGMGEMLVGGPRHALPDLPLLAVVALLPLAVATRVVNTPGAAAAACGAYLLPRTLVTLANQSLEPPPLLLVPAVAFDVALWMRMGDLARLWRGVTGGGKRWRKRVPPLTRT